MSETIHTEAVGSQIIFDDQLLKENFKLDILEWMKYNLDSSTLFNKYYSYSTNLLNQAAKANLLYLQNQTYSLTTTYEDIQINDIKEFTNIYYNLFKYEYNINIENEIDKTKLIRTNNYINLTNVNFKFQYLQNLEIKDFLQLWSNMCYIPDGILNTNNVIIPVFKEDYNNNLVIDFYKGMLNTVSNEYEFTIQEHYVIKTYKRIDYFTYKVSNENGTIKISLKGEQPEYNIYGIDNYILYFRNAINVVNPINKDNTHRTRCLISICDCEQQYPNLTLPTTRYFVCMYDNYKNPYSNFPPIYDTINNTLVAKIFNPKIDNLDERFKIFPFIPLRLSQQNITEYNNIYYDNYVKACKLMNIEYKEFQENILNNIDNINNIYNAYFLFIFSINTPNKFFDNKDDQNTYVSVFLKLLDEWGEIRSQVVNDPTFPAVEMNSLAFQIKDGNFNINLTSTIPTTTIQTGVIEPNAQIGDGYLDLVTVVRPPAYIDGEPYNEDIILVKQQITKNTYRYTEIPLDWNFYCTRLSAEKEEFYGLVDIPINLYKSNDLALLPIPVSVLSKLTAKEKEILLKVSFRFFYYAVQWTKLEWYQTGWFKFLIHWIGIILSAASMVLFPVLGTVITTISTVISALNPLINTLITQIDDPYIKMILSNVIDIAFIAFNIISQDWGSLASNVIDLATDLTTNYFVLEAEQINQERLSLYEDYTNRYTELTNKMDSLTDNPLNLFKLHTKYSMEDYINNTINILYNYDKYYDLVTTYVTEPLYGMYNYDSIGEYI